MLHLTRGLNLRRYILSDSLIVKTLVRAIHTHSLQPSSTFIDEFLQKKHERSVIRRFVPKVSVLIFYLNVYRTHLKLQVISFKVWPLGSYTVVPTFFLLIIAVPEVIFCMCV